MTCQIFMLRKELCSIALSILWPSDEDLAYTMTSAVSNYTRNKCSTQIEHYNLENKTKTTRKVTNLSFNLVLQASCQVSAYYSLSLSIISSMSHG